MALKSTKIPLVASNGAVLTFNSSDYIKIRKTHRILGNLIGVTASHPNDLSMKGLPALYSPFETKLLLDEEIVEIQCIPESANEKVQEEYQAFVKKQFEAQLHWTVCAREITRNDQWYQVPNECLFKDPQQRDPSPDLVDPDPVKYKVYCDLWNRGYFITNGHSFGGDFLIYPQDPIVCHATHVVHVLHSPVINIKDLITTNRLCVGVKKECLFAYSDSGGAIKYQSSIWDSTWDK